MSAAGWPLEFGRAVDGRGTKNRHQIFSLDYDYKKSLYCLHYSVCSQDLLVAPDQLATPEFIEALSQDIINNPANTKASARNFSQFMQKMRRGTSKNKGYKLDQITPSITYEIFFGGDYEVSSFDCRVTNAVMIDTLYDDEAEQRIHVDFNDDELKVWHDFALHTMQEHFFEGAYKTNLKFSTVTDVTTDIIKPHLYDLARVNKMDCVCRHSPFEKPLDIHPDNVPRKERVKTLFYQFGSILSDKKGEPKRIKNMENKAIVSATASRNAIDAYNQIVIKEYSQNKGVNPFPEGTGYAFAHYRDQLNEIRRMNNLALVA